MKILKYKKDRHYQTMSKLWESYGWMPCPQEAIPRASLVAETDGGEFIAFLSMYVEPGRIGFIDWALKDRKHDKALSDKALRELFSILVDVAKKSKCAFIYSMTKTKAWGDKLVSYGMQVAETEATTYILSLDGIDTSFIRD